MVLQERVLKYEVSASHNYKHFEEKSQHFSNIVTLLFRNCFYYCLKRNLKRPVAPLAPPDSTGPAEAGPDNESRRTTTKAI